MTGIKDWSTTAGNNDNADSAINWAEGQAPSTVNNSSRAMMALIRTQWNQKDWFEYGDGDETYSISRVGKFQFQVEGSDQTAEYHAGRRVKLTGASTDQYGAIVSSSLSGAMTEITISMSTSISTGHTGVEIGMSAANGSPLPWPLHIDGANKRLGVGTFAPATQLHVVGDVTVDGDFVGDMAFQEQVSISGTLNVGGSVSFATTLHVVGAATFDADSVFNEQVSISGTLNVGGTVSFASTLHVVGAVEFDDKLSISGSLNVNSGPVSFGSTLVVTGALTQTGVATFGAAPIVAVSNDGADTSLTIRNTAGSGSTDETVSLIAEHVDGNGPGGKIVFGRTSDYSSDANEDSFMGLYTATNGADGLRLLIATNGVITIGNLAGSGSRTVVADANGVLSAP